MPSRVVPAALVAVLSVAVAACGGDAGSTGSPSAEVTRTIDVEMADIEFRPAQLQVRAGETVRFRFTNTGSVAHDAFVGDRAAQDEHGEEMRDRDHAGHGAGDDAITVAPGATGELVRTFETAGDLLIGCHQPGHFDAGMVTTITVA